MLRAPLSTTGELGRDYGASTTRRKVPAAVPGATTGIPRVASQTKQNKTKRFGRTPLWAVSTDAEERKRRHSTKNAKSYVQVGLRCAPRLAYKPV